MGTYSDADWQRFSGLPSLTNHWNRNGWWPGRRGYYWYLTFEHEADLQLMAKRCQEAIRAPWFDLVPTDFLHMTLDRIAFTDDISMQELRDIQLAAANACQDIAPFPVDIGPLAGSNGALSFSASPTGRITNLWSTLRRVTSATLRGEDSDDDTLRPHVGIAYCNTDIPATPVIEAVKSLRQLQPVTVTVRHASLVLLIRDQRAYRWEVQQRIPLSGCG